MAASRKKPEKEGQRPRKSAKIEAMMERFLETRTKQAEDEAKQLARENEARENEIRDKKTAKSDEFSIKRFDCDSNSNSDGSYGSDYTSESDGDSGSGYNSESDDNSKFDCNAESDGDSSFNSDSKSDSDSEFDYNSKVQLHRELIDDYGRLANDFFDYVVGTPTTTSSFGDDARRDTKRASRGTD
ncbi:uncharacterized protein LOC111257720 [Setaria italica]|uniref:uncharacterized protein LOC111257720 n=1 Tax=Setaria italica TaxID=4555 RepID=UPI000BE56C2F|nr:uncharacterized protein LOC111257720 [Setaria italica]